jgi:hypothetical protein
MVSVLDVVLNLEGTNAALLQNWDENELKHG